MIPKELTEKHLKEAAAEIDRHGVPPGRNSVHYDLVLGGIKYPPKYIVSLAAKFATGVEYPAEEFNAVEAKNYFLNKGYVVVDRRVSDSWSKEELKASVEAYIEMQLKARTGQPYTKKHYYEELAAQFGRTEKAFEYRMQNISYVLSLMGRDWLIGLKPAKNVGANVAAEIERLFIMAVGRKSIPVVAFEIAVKKEATKKHFFIPTGTRYPKITTSEVTQIQRDIAVKGWVLQQTNGKCESCERPAPFNGSDGLPYLEVHHVHHLADSGFDTVTNAVALCPNCHRELHYGENSQILLTRPLNSFKRHILRVDLGSKKRRVLDCSPASSCDRWQRHAISLWYAPALSIR